MKWVISLHEDFVKFRRPGKQKICTETVVIGDAKVGVVFWDISLSYHGDRQPAPAEIAGLVIRTYFRQWCSLNLGYYINPYFWGENGDTLGRGRLTSHKSWHNGWPLCDLRCQARTLKFLFGGEKKLPKKHHPIPNGVSNTKNNSDSTDPLSKVASFFVFLFSNLFCSLAFVCVQPQTVHLFKKLTVGLFNATFSMCPGVFLVGCVCRTTPLSPLEHHFRGNTINGNTWNDGTLFWVQINISFFFFFGRSMFSSRRAINNTWTWDDQDVFRPETRDPNLT